MNYVTYYVCYFMSVIAQLAFVLLCFHIVFMQAET